MEKPELKELIMNNLNNKLPNIEEELPKIINNYHALCKDLETFLHTKLDIFKQASCLLIAINNSNLLKNKLDRASLALNTALSLFANPLNVPTPLDFKDEAITNSEAFKSYQNTLLQALSTAKNCELDYYIDLELLYKLGLLIKDSKTITNPNLTFDTRKLTK